MAILAPQIEKPTTTIRPTKRWELIRPSEIWKYRDLLRAFTVRDLKLRYKQTALGALWIVAQPLAASGIFSFVFGKIAKFPSDGVPYPLFAYAGMIGWQAFSQTFTKVSGCLLANQNLLTKVYFPRIVLPLSYSTTAAVDSCVAFTVVIAMLGIYGLPLSWTMLLLPVLFVVLLTLAISLGLIAASMSVKYRDAQHIIPVLIPMLLYATPIAYSLKVVPEEYHAIVLMNPVAGLIIAGRWAILGKGLVPWPFVAYSVVFTAAAFIYSTVLFRRIERKLADVI